MSTELACCSSRLCLSSCSISRWTNFDRHPHETILYALIDWLVVNATFCSISAISWHFALMFFYSNYMAASSVQLLGLQLYSMFFFPFIIALSIVYACSKGNVFFMNVFCVFYNIRRVWRYQRGNQTQGRIQGGGRAHPARAPLKL